MTGSDFETNTEVLAGGAKPVLLRSRTIRVDVASGPAAGVSFEVPGPSARVGSGQGSDIALADPTVSRHHLTLRIEEPGLRVIDAGSRNGTWLDGIRVRDAYARPDSTIAIGQTTLRLRLSHDLVELPLSPRTSFGGLLGQSVAMRQVFTVLERVAPTDDTILVIGETGTGKELVAEAIHEESPRATGPFVVFDCSAVASNLLESELFGHLRGSFTGAVADRAGALEAADGGTLFLDELGELPLDLQPKLLRALERFEVRRVGSNTARKVDLRIVAATNRNLEDQVARGVFREDLYYRLAVVTVHLPPLRERPEDIAVLTESFVRQLSHRGGVERRLPEGALQTFEGQAWPGNVRELRNAVARALSLGVTSGMGEPLLRATAPNAPSAIDLSIPLKTARDRLGEAFERDYVMRALEETGGNVSRAAELAGVDRKFIQRVIKQHRLRGETGDT